MITLNNLHNFFEQGHLFHPNLSIDCVIFGFHEGLLKVLLLEFKNTKHLALPGGFVYKDESVDAAAKRILEERTGLKNIYLEQFYTFGAAERCKNSVHKVFLDANQISNDENHWLLGRYVSVGYYALVDFSKVSPTPDILSDFCDWYEINQLPDLILDHRAMIDKALENLSIMIDYKLLVFNLLPETFTMNELQALYETIMGKKLLRTNFQRKMLSLDILERVDKKKTGGAHKAPYLYRFKRNNL
jgi:hypothetical protein